MSDSPADCAEFVIVIFNGVNIKKVILSHNEWKEYTNAQIIKDDTVIIVRWNAHRLVSL